MLASHPPISPAQDLDDGCVQVLQRLRRRGAKVPIRCNVTAGQGDFGGRRHKLQGEKSADHRAAVCIVQEDVAEVAGLHPRGLEKVRPLKRRHNNPPVQDGTGEKVETAVLRPIAAKLRRLWQREALRPP